jgi:E3 ubiquitin-protein ligase FANCL
MSLLFPNKDFSQWEGFIAMPQQQQEKQFFIRIIVSNEISKICKDSSVQLPISLKGSTFQCDSNLSSILNHQLIEQRLNKSYSIDSFIFELKDSIINELLFTTTTAVLPNFQSSIKLLNDLENIIGWNNIIEMNGLDDVHVRIVDEANRSHTIQLILPNDYPNSSIIVNGLSITTTTTTTIENVMKEISKQISQFQSVWNVLDEFDSQCCILEPLTPSMSRDVLARRVALGSHRTLSFLIDWQKPHAMPKELTLFGPESMIQPLRERLASAAAAAQLHWNANLSLVDNLSQLLGFELPRSINHKREEFVIECGICYAYRSGDDGAAVPDAVCNNERCGRSFHESCLFEWLRSIPSNTLTFETIFGQCPFCSTNISARQH